MKKLYLTHADIAVDPALEPSGWLKGAFLLIEDGIIEELSPTPLPSPRVEGAEVLTLSNRVVTPAWINGHTHLSQTFLRGLVGDRPLLRWLKEAIWPLQQAFSPAVLEAAALLGLAENIRSGVGLVVDHQKITQDESFTEKVFQAAQQSGLKVWIARAWSDRGSGAENPQALLEELEKWMQNNRTSWRVKFANGPLAPWRCSAETLKASHQLALQYDAFTHIHVSETQEEVKLTWDEYGKHPVEWLESLGILDDHLQIVHGVWVREAEIQLLAERKPLVVHCPVSNAVLGSGIAPLRKFLERGIPVRLGTDGPASNDVQDCFETMKFALCLARAAAFEPSSVPPRLALEMAWGKPGLRRGDAADLAILRLDTVWTAPVHDLDSALALSARAGNVESLLVDGEFVLREGNVLTLDEESLIEECSALLKWLRQKAGLDRAAEKMRT